MFNRTSRTIDSITRRTIERREDILNEICQKRNAGGMLYRDLNRSLDYPVDFRANLEALVASGQISKTDEEQPNGQWAYTYRFVYWDGE